MKVAPVFIRTEFNYDMMAASNASGLLCEDESRAVQSAKEECDINTIVKRFGLTGQLPSDVRVPSYVDFADGVFDFHSAMNMVSQAREGFDRMPADVRSRFHNDPGEMLDFLGNEENRVEAEKLGLVMPKPLPVVPEAVLVRLEKEAADEAK